MACGEAADPDIGLAHKFIFPTAIADEGMFCFARVRRRFRVSRLNPQYLLKATNFSRVFLYSVGQRGANRGEGRIDRGT